MNAQEFAYWMKGAFELGYLGGVSDYESAKHALRIIEDHLNLVFNKVTPSYNHPTVPKLSELFKDQLGPLHAATC